MQICRVEGKKDRGVIKNEKKQIGHQNRENTDKTLWKTINTARRHMTRRSRESSRTLKLYPYTANSVMYGNNEYVAPAYIPSPLSPGAYTQNSTLSRRMLIRLFKVSLTS